MNVEKFKILSLDTRIAACIIMCPIENLEETGQEMAEIKCAIWIPLTFKGSCFLFRKGPV